LDEASAVEVQRMDHMALMPRRAIAPHHPADKKGHGRAAAVAQTGSSIARVSER
jgi:hypothetical protein